jgi:hypothetical protein
MEKAWWLWGLTLVTTVCAYPVVVLDDNSLAVSDRQVTVNSFELKGDQVAPNFGLFDSTCAGRFGFSVATDSSAGNKSGLIAIGVPGRDAVLILEPKDGFSQGRLLADNWVVDVDLHSEDTKSCYQQKEYFGIAVALWDNWIAISSCFKGKVYLYEKSKDGTRWDSRGFIDATVLDGWNREAEYGKRLNWFSKDGNLYLLVSAPNWYCRSRHKFLRGIFGNSQKRKRCGCVFIYKLIAQTYSWKLIQTIYPPQEWSIETSAGWISFGEAVVLWNEHYFAVGAPGSACWKLKESISRRRQSCGSVFMYHWNNERMNYLWEIQPHDIKGGDAFGTSLASLDPFSLAVGAPRQDCFDGNLPKSSCGGVYFIEVSRVDNIARGKLRRIQKYKPDIQLESFGLFGFALEASQDGNLLFVSAPGSWNERGSVFRLKRESDRFPWTESNLSFSRWLWKESSPFTNLGWQLRLLSDGHQYWLLASAPFAHFQQGSLYIVPFVE